MCSSLFGVFLYTVYACSKTESESQGDDRSETELDG